MAAVPARGRVPALQYVRRGVVPYNHDQYYDNHDNHDNHDHHNNDQQHHDYDCCSL